MARWSARGGDRPTRAPGRGRDSLTRRMDLQVTERGRGDVLVGFVHGVLDRGRSFMRVARILDEECRMTWYDRRGYGASVDAARPGADIDAQVADVLTVLDGRHGVVVGHSFGGMIALGAAAAAPDLVDALVVYETRLAWAAGYDDSMMRALVSHPHAEE